MGNMTNTFGRFRSVSLQFLCVTIVALHVWHLFMANRACRSNSRLKAARSLYHSNLVVNFPGRWILVIRLLAMPENLSLRVHCIRAPAKS